jgi:hypothetical protein
MWSGTQRVWSIIVAKVMSHVCVLLCTGAGVTVIEWVHLISIAHSVFERL